MVNFFAEIGDQREPTNFDRAVARFGGRSRRPTPRSDDSQCGINALASSGNSNPRSVKPASFGGGLGLRCVLGLLAGLLVLSPTLAADPATPKASQKTSSALAKQAKPSLQASLDAFPLKKNWFYLAGPRPGEDWHAWLAQLQAYRSAFRSHPHEGADDSIYRRHDLAWMTSNFVCGFVFIYDRSFWDPARIGNADHTADGYRVDTLCSEAREDFGGFDSIVLWHAYPRIGVDQRNQFDYFRDMPGGLSGLAGAVRKFHRHGVKVFIPYNPWDTGTARERESDDQALARIVAAIEADGIFLDTMNIAPKALRQAVDAVRPGVAFEPEGHPAIPELAICNGSWAQYLNEFPEIGVLQLKWLEPRHMQHQIRRWEKSHQGELAAAWLNGSGIMVWENIFGMWNPWNAEDRATLRRMAPVLRRFAPLLAEGKWFPYYPTMVSKLYASCWQTPGVRLWTLVNKDLKNPVGPVLEIDDQGEQLFDLWRGQRLKPVRAGGKLRLSCDLKRFGAILAVKEKTVQPWLASLLETQRRESLRPLPTADNDPHVAMQSVIEPKPLPACPAVAPSDAKGMLQLRAATDSFTLRHLRRECGCYPDPGTPPAEWEKFLTGTPHINTIEHHVTATLRPGWIDAKPVTNAEFEAFLKATHFAPPCRDQFLKHWGGPTCPSALGDKPVVYVDLEDARAYAAWAKRRLPTEWEWQQAAQDHGPAFDHAEVFEWTESERDDGHTRFVLLRGGCRYESKGSIWYFPTGPRPVDSHLKFLRLAPGLDRSSTIGFRCVAAGNGG